MIIITAASRLRRAKLLLLGHLSCRCQRLLLLLRRIVDVVIIPNMAKQLLSSRGSTIAGWRYGP